MRSRANPNLCLACDQLMEDDSPVRIAHAAGIGNFPSSERVSSSDQLELPVSLANFERASGGK